MNNKEVLVVIFLFIAQGLFAQQANIPLGTWRIHNSFYSANAVQATPSKVWCGTSGGLFYLDKEDNSINTLSKKDGLGGLNISALKYSSARDLLLVGYEDGNLDVIKKGSIFNIQDILKSNKSGLKKINHIGLYGKYALLSCDFGVVLFDLDKLEIKESYLNIGLNGSSPKINYSSTKGDSLFLATSQGILTAKFGTANLIDFKNWKRIPTIDSLTAKEINSIAVVDQSVYFGIEKRGIYSNKSGSWQPVITFTGNPLAMATFGNQLFVSVEDTIIKIQNGNISYISGGIIYKAKGIAIDQEGSIWLSEEYFSLVKYNEGTFANFIPNSPYYNQAFAFYHYKKKMVALSGGYTDIGTGNGQRKGYFEFENNTWNNYIPGNNTGYIADATSAAYSPWRNTLFIGTQNEGVMAVNQNSGQITYIDDETVGCKLSRAAFGYDNVRALSIYHDDNTGNLWICNPLGSYENYNTIHVYKPDNTCNSYKFPFDASKFPLNIIMDDAGNKWVRLRNSTGGGLIVFNEKIKSDDGITPKYVYLLEGKGNGNLSSSSVKCLIKDLKGDIWVGTTKGISVFYSPNSNPAKISEASTPIFQNRPLLFDQIITCIDVDGGNRKWIGTSNGLYLFNQDGTQVIHYFNSENSPMSSNYVVSVKADPQTGEVFIGTDANIVSYREPASVGLEEAPSEINIFPNPVSQNFEGWIGISGLATNAIVKIVDVTGNLVYETKANGGTASWNGRDYKGRKISAGAYVILTSKDNGEVAATGKLFVTE